MTKDVNKLAVNIKVNRLNLVPDRYYLQLILSPAVDRNLVYHRIEKAASFILLEYSLNSKKIDLKSDTSPPVVFSYDYEIG